MFDKLSKMLDSFIEMGIPGYDIIVKQHGETVFRRMDGFSDRDAGIRMRGDELYYVYSCSKVLTCTAAMQLYEKGLFKLDDELWHYLPEYKDMMVRTEDGTIVPAKHRITIRNLFTMTAGMNYDRDSNAIRRARERTNGRCPTREVIREIAQEPLEYEPGTKWQYSLAHDVIVALVEVVTGMKFNDYITKSIFEPLGMKNSSYILTPELEKRIAPLYAYDAETKRFNVFHGNFYIFGPEYASGGAGCITTVEDYSIFLEALRTADSIIGRKTLELMTTDMLDDVNRPYYWNQDRGYGLGVRCPNFAFGPRTDFGWGGAAGAWLAVDWPHDYTAFYTQHVLYSPNSGLRDGLHNLIVDGL